MQPIHARSYRLRSEQKIELSVYLKKYSSPSVCCIVFCRTFTRECGRAGNKAEKYKKTMLRSQTHAIEAIGIDDIVVVVEVTSGMPSATDRNCNWQLSNAAVEITKSMLPRS